MSRLVCWFSCGAASAVATKLAISKNDGREVVIVRCWVAEEHPSNDVFHTACEHWFGQSIQRLINERYRGRVHEVIRQRKFISGPKGAPCTLLLKKELREAFELPTDRHVMGYTVDEQDRFDRFLDANNIDCVAPLIEAGLTHADCLAIVQDAGIELPKMYQLGYKHNNCIGCVKATGAGYWNKIRREFRPAFDRMAQVSRGLGVRMVKVGEERVFLDELPEGIGNYSDEPEIQCGIFCELAKDDIAKEAV